MAYLSRAKLKFEAFCYFITYTTGHVGVAALAF